VWHLEDFFFRLVDCTGIWKIRELWGSGGGYRNLCCLLDFSVLSSNICREKEKGIVRSANKKKEENNNI